MWKVLVCWKEEVQCEIKWGLISPCGPNQFKAEESSAASCHPSNWVSKSLSVNTKCQSALEFGNWDSWLIYIFCFLFLRAVGSENIIFTEGERKNSKINIQHAYWQYMRADDRSYAYVWKLVSRTCEFKLKKDKASFQHDLVQLFPLCWSSWEQTTIRICKYLLFQINKKGWEQLPVPPLKFTLKI